MAGRVEREPALVLRDEIDLRDGRTLETASLPLWTGGRVSGRVWRVRDVTEARRAEAALRHAQKLESLGVMSAGIAHDFNNLLVPILGNAKLLQDRLPPDPEAEAMLADVEAAAEQAGDLTRQLLAYAGKGAPEFRPVDPSAVARESVALAGVSVGRRVGVTCELLEEPPAVTGDPGQLRQVLVNLILNAVDAIGEAPGRVTVSTAVEVLGAREGRGLRGAAPWRAGRYVAMRVSDTGCGIDADLQERIFDPFFTTKFAGRGLGLAATLGIVRSHGGYLRVESAPGRGTEFTVFLPAGDGPAPRPPSAPAAVAGDAGVTVLVVDDEPGVLRVAERTLRQAGLRVFTAPDGAEAVRLYAERTANIDVVLLDVTMPGIGGVEVYRKLREIDPGVKVVFSSGHPERELGDALAPGESAEFVQKPYDPADLVAVVREVAGSTSPSRP
jgi:signal transduction histidine kinase/ActR/RegA family two-component response regulator